MCQGVNLHTKSSFALNDFSTFLFCRNIRAQFMNYFLNSCGSFHFQFPNWRKVAENKTKKKNTQKQKVNHTMRCCYNFRPWENGKFNSTRNSNANFFAKLKNCNCIATIFLQTYTQAVCCMRWSLSLCGFVCVWHTLYVHIHISSSLQFCLY